MSKNFLTRKQALSKIGKTGGGTNFVTKSYLVSNGFSTTPLTKYKNTDFVIDDDILAGSSTNYTLTLGSFTLCMGFDNGTLSKYSLISPSDQSRYIIALLCVKDSDGSLYVSSQYHPSVGSESSFYPNTPITVSSMNVKVRGDVTLQEIYVILYSDSSSVVLLNGGDNNFVWTYNSYYIRCQMRNTTDVNFNTGKTPYIKSYSITDTNGVTTNCKWSIRIPLMDVYSLNSGSGGYAGVWNIGSSLDSMPTKLSSNYTMNYPYKGALYFNNYKS